MFRAYCPPHGSLSCFMQTQSHCITFASFWWTLLSLMAALSLGLATRWCLQHSRQVNQTAHLYFARLLPIVQAARFSQPLLYNAHALLQSLRQSLAWYVLQSSLSAVLFEDLNSARVAASQWWKFYLEYPNQFVNLATWQQGRYLIQFFYSYEKKITYHSNYPFLFRSKLCFHFRLSGKWTGNLKYSAPAEIL